mgnify:CR=1 FL=1
MVFLRAGKEQQYLSRTTLIFLSLLVLTIVFAASATALAGAGHRTGEASGSEPTVLTHTHDTNPVAESIMEGFMTGGLAFFYITLMAMLPLLWVSSLMLHLARPYMLRTIKKFNLRFGADVWWLVYVMLRDAVMIMTFIISIFFFFPDKIALLPMPVTAPLATILLFWGLAVKLTRDGDNNPRDYRLITYFMTAGAVVYLVPFLFGHEAPMEGEVWNNLRTLLTSSSNPGVALPILYVSQVLLALTGGYISNFVMRSAKGKIKKA